MLLVLTLVMAISGAAGAFAAGGRFHRATPSDEPTCVEPTPADDPVEQDIEEGDEGEPCEVPEPDPTDEPDDDGAGGPDATDPAREAECATAAGWEDGVLEAEDGEKLHGVDNAMAHVYENCLKNDAPGLVNALERLAANAARHEAREAEKAVREAERAAEKAAREAERAERKAERDAAKDERKAEHAAAGHGNPHD